MSNLVCRNCKSISVEYEDYVGGTLYYRCKTCGQWGDKDKFTQQTVFHRITASPEVLAEKLVYCLDSSSFRVIDSAGRLLAYENEVWASTILPGSFWTKYEEAIAATVAKLKEVCDEQNETFYKNCGNYIQ